MKVSQFLTADDMVDIRAWLKERSIDPKILRDMPASGFVACDNGEKICAGFFRLSEGALGILEGLITNPKSTSLRRHLGIDAVVNAIKTLAREMEVKQIIAYTIEPSIIERAKVHRFTVQPHTLLHLNLSGEE